MFNKAQLAERGKHYFNDSKVSKMYATTDGNFFYEQDKNYADSHSKTLKTALIEITRADLVEKKEEKSKKEDEPKPSDNPEKNTELPGESNSVASPSELDELRAEGKKLKIKGFAIMKAETLKRKIAEVNGTS